MKKSLTYGVVLMLMLTTMSTNVFACVPNKNASDVREKLRSEGTWLTPEESAAQKMELDSILESLDKAAEMSESPSYSYDMENNPTLYHWKVQMDVILAVITSMHGIR